MVFKKTVKNTNTTTEEYTVEQERYLEYHSAKKKITDRWLFHSIIFALVVAVIGSILSSLPGAGWITVLILLISQIIYVIWIRKSGKSSFKIGFSLMLLAWVLSSIFYLFQSFQINILLWLVILTSTFMLLIPMINSSYEKRGMGDAKLILPYMKETSTTEHTAVIFPHNKNRLADGGDGVALKLLEGLEKYNEEFQIYFCLTSEELIQALTNPLVKRIWIFGHGNRGGCGLTDGQFIYSEYMLERTEDGWEQRKITPKEYVYQCHCNREKLQSLADYLVLGKGVLDSSVDDMPNYFDTGFINMESVSSKKYGKLYFYQKGAKVLHSVFKKDLNYMSDDSAEYVIDRYLAHLEKKQKMSE